ncbi:hypothetical protein [Dialister sp.]|uniref:hypothetical protein n=1 Tax=Dialister sp. TaxID=1955814 RepID=UPI002E810E92|nr:hypothetical protein [Dialister sp.]MEE3453142.1 hypothetical protein [Dialister sp.]
MSDFELSMKAVHDYLDFLEKNYLGSRVISMILSDNVITRKNVRMIEAVYQTAKDSLQAGMPRRAFHYALLLENLLKNV